MLALEKLQFKLNAFLQDEAHRPRIRRFEGVARLADQLDRRHGASQTNLGPSPQRLDRALEVLYREGVAQACETRLRYLCHALLRPYGSDQRRLIADATRFLQVLRQIESRIHAKTLSVHWWHGLLDAYFQFDGDSHSQSNWRELRSFLGRTLTDIQAQTVRHRPKQWLDALAEHRNLLTDDPCGRYANATLNGNLAEVDSLRERLRIPEQSWFWMDLLRAQGRALTGLNDETFRNLLDGFLNRMGDPRRVPDVLATLLNRYYHSQFQNTAHPSLQRVALETWGSPNLGRNIRWGHVDDSVRQMVLRWLSREDIQDFFRLLIQDQVGDERRLKFWMRYADAIQETHIVLGKHALGNDSDYVEMRKRKSGRVSILMGDNNPQNNAFIMSFGRYVVVEFGGKGNACYIYDANDFQMPEHSYLRYGSIPENKIYIRNIKDRSKAKNWLSHSAEWEEPFEGILERLDIYPSLQRSEMMSKEVRLRAYLKNSYEDTERQQKKEIVTPQIKPNESKEENNCLSNKIDILIHGRYQDHGDGTVTDIKTGLRWKRCAEGQTWTGNNCVGEAKKYKWNDLSSLVCDGWHVPTKDELKTLVYCSNTKELGKGCKGKHEKPTIDQEAFPATPVSDFWSGSTVVGNSDGAWYVSFYHGNDYHGNDNWYNRNAGLAVRLVRGQ